MTRIVVNINLKELNALVELVRTEMRRPQDQVRYVLHQKLIERNLLPSEAMEDKSSKPFKGTHYA